MNLDHIFRIDNNEMYISRMRPVFNRRALFSDTTAEYITPQEPEAYDEVKIRFRTARNNVDHVFLICKGVHRPMEKVESNEDFDFYECRIRLGEEKITYYFAICSGHLIGFYDVRGLVQEVNDYYSFVIIPGFHTPKWAKGAVMYQIFVDRFCNGDSSNDVQTGEYAYIDEPVRRVEDWYQNPQGMDVRSFYGGDLQGVLDKMDYLQQLGIEVIYFNPLFVSPSNHKYDTQDYDYIDPHIGKILVDADGILPQDSKDNSYAEKYKTRVTNRENLEASNELFVRVVEEAHRRGIRVIIDGVFNHCGSFHKWMDREHFYDNADGYEKGAFYDGGSPYRGYFDFKEDKWPDNNSYEGWWGHKTLPKLYFENSKELQDAILQIGRKWVSAPYYADGWRLDMAADLGHSQEFNHHFWKEFRKSVKEANPEAIILAEHYGNTKDWLQGDEWDTVMNYDAFMEPITWFLTGMEKHSDDFREDLLGNAESFWRAMMHHNASFSMPSFQTAMNELSNHDHSRFLTRTNHQIGRIDSLGSEAAAAGVRKEIFREAVVMQMTWMGAPTIYYGDEAGLCGFTDPDNRRTYPWGREDHELIAFHRDIIRLRRENDELRCGSIKYVDGAQNYLAYGRFHSRGQCVILINNAEEVREQTVSVWELGIPKNGRMKVIFKTDKNGYYMDGETYEIKNGKIRLTLPGTSAMILKSV